MNLKNYEIDISDYQKKKIIGKGGSATVYLAEDENGEEVALKEFNSKIKKIDRKSVYREIATLTSVYHPFLIKFIGVSLSDPFTIVTNYVQNGSLFKIIHSKKLSKILDGTRKTIIAVGIAHAMSYLHKQSIIHRDLKSTNILIDEDYYPVICDFGIARFAHNNEPLTECIGPLQWMAPEVLEGNEYSFPADVYSYGTILYEMSTGLVPWGDMETSKLERNLMNGKRPQIPPNVPQSIQAMIRKCWNDEPFSRPTFEKIYEMFVSGRYAFDDCDKNEIDLLDMKLKKAMRKTSTSKSKSVLNDYNMKKTPKNYKFNSEINYSGKKVKNMNSENGFNRAKDKLRSYDRTLPYDGYKQNSSSSSSDDDDDKFSNKSKKSFSKSMKKSSATPQIRKRNQNDDTSFVDISAISNTRDYFFRPELKKAAMNLQKVQSRAFFVAIEKYLKKPPAKAEMSIILDTCHKVIQKNCHMSTFMQMQLFNLLPYEKSDYSDICLAILLLISKKPQKYGNIILNDFSQRMELLSTLYPEQIVIILSYLFEYLPNSQCEHLLFDKSDVFTSSSSASEYISLLFELSRQNKSFRQSNLTNILFIFNDCLSLKDIKCVQCCYNSLSYYSKNIEDLDFITIGKHLENEDLCEYALDLLLRIKELPVSKQLILSLISAAKEYEEAKLCLLKIIALEEGAKILVKCDGWLTRGNPTYFGTLQLLLACMVHYPLRQKLKMNQDIPFFLSNLIDQSDDTRILMYISVIVQKLIPDEDFVQSLINNDVIGKVVATALEIDDGPEMMAIITLLYSVSKVNIYCTEYSQIAERLKKIISNGSDLVPSSIALITELSKFPICARKFVQLKLDKYFKRLMEDPDYIKYAKKFAKNIAACNIY